MIAMIGYDWTDSASCWAIAQRRGDNPFFQEGRGAHYTEARTYCAPCPVVIDCLIEGLREDNVGFWGCTSDADRVAIRRNLRRGVTFMGAVEAIWARQRGRTLVPEPKVWDEWHV